MSWLNFCRVCGKKILEKDSIGICKNCVKVRTIKWEVE